MRPSDFEPTIVRTNRICSTAHCPNAALFYPWIEVFFSRTRKSHPLQIEVPRQYCPHCMDKIKNADDIGNDWRTVLANAERHFNEKYDSSTARVFWVPLIIDSESQQAPHYSQRFHD